VANKEITATSYDYDAMKHPASPLPPKAC